MQNFFKSKNLEMDESDKVRGEGVQARSEPEPGTQFKNIQAPQISLPKGGGAIRGIGEKFAANPVTGTGSMTVPIATSPGRSGFGPQLSLSYDSGAGNGPFGFGWNLFLPSITRKTDKGLPKYQDGDESDTFILSGAEDLVPVLKKQGNDWVPEDVPDRTIKTDTYRIKRYRPRIEGLFARIEHWTNTRTNETHWRSISRDNITTIYGRTTNSRIEDPDAPDDLPRVFSWLICESYDDKGNAIYYEYVPEDSAGIDLSWTNERNRTDKSRSANRYLKRIKYGNKTPVEHDSNLPREFREDLSKRKDWLFEVVFDYLAEEKNHEVYEQHYKQLAPDADDQIFIEEPSIKELKTWDIRQDPFSSYRAGFEVRIYRLCYQVLMFHHFTDELDVDDYLVRSIEFTYKSGPIASFITSVTQSGFKRQNDDTYLKKSLPPLEFIYSEATIQDKVEDVDEESLENLPQGLDGTQYQWADIDGEGSSGILTEQGDSWFYKRNLSALPVIDKDGEPHTVARFATTECLAEIPSFTNLSSGRQQFMDLAGDGQLDVVEFDSPTPGFFERTKDKAWHPFKPFVSLPNISWQDPNLKFVDLTGDGHADIFITEDEIFTWYQSLAETGFASGERVRQALDEEKGPKLIFADGTQSVYLADISGDGLTDLARIRNGEVCYWPNLGYGRFGAKVTMDNSPLFDAPDQFDQQRIRLADIDGSGVTDIIYLKGDGVYIYLNESGNRWTDAKKLKSFPKIDNLSSVMAVDLLGNGTACLVWSSPLPGHARKPMRYIDLMGGQKPHLLIKTMNNLGAETHVHYAPSTRFYLADKLAGKPWITRIPFPVHVVECVETYDCISRNRFVTRYAYHHGYFDSEEREFRGFGMVEQWDTEEFATLSTSGDFPIGDNIDAATHVPPVLTKTWFHTGAYIGRSHISNFFAGLLDANDIGEYYREPGLTDAQAQQLLLNDTVLPGDLTIDEEREACRALKGSMLRQEVYALDGTDRQDHPYTVTEQNFTIKCLQGKADNQHAVFFTHAREAINYHYERDPADPRVSHSLTLEVDLFGNIRKSIAIAYGRRKTIKVIEVDGSVSEIQNPKLSELDIKDQNKQTQALITYTENDVTNAIDKPITDPHYDADNYRVPSPSESCSYELTGIMPDGRGERFTFKELIENNYEKICTLPSVPYETLTDYAIKRKRLIESLRILYRKNDLTELLGKGELEYLALPGESYKLAFTPRLAKQIYVDSGKVSQADLNTILANEGKYVHSESDANWWIPSGRAYYHLDADAEDPSATAGVELAEARQHFFLPRKYVDPFHTNTVSTEVLVYYDKYDLLHLETRDPLGNRVTVGERKLDDTIDPNKPGNDYRVLQPWRVMGPNRNRTTAAFDTLGMVVATAVMGKDGEDLGDLLEDFDPDPTLVDLQAFITDPQGRAGSYLGKATTRIIYDIDRFHKSCQAYPAEPEKWEPAFAATLARETHFYDPLPPSGLKIQIGFTYSDGFGREIQKKIQAEPGPVPKRDSEGKIIVDSNGIPEMTTNDVEPRWVGSGWTIFNNKGKPVRQYEPFFSDTYKFDADVRIGVSSILFYDPVGRVIATLHPNHTYEKVVFDPWKQTTYDVNDTVTFDPSTDNELKGFLLNPDGTPRIPLSEYQPRWHQLRTDAAHAVELAEQYPDAIDRLNETAAANKAAAHADTPTTAFFDTLGRPFLTIAHNKVACPNHDLDGTEDKFQTRVELDIEGNQRAVIDAKGRAVMSYNYYMAGPEENKDGATPNRIHQSSMEAGKRWILNDVAGKPIYSWDSRGHQFRTTYDQLRRPTESYMSEGAGPVLVEQTVYGETRTNPEVNNMRGQVVQLKDQAGIVTSENYDFKGNRLSSQRQLAQEYKTTLDWSAAVPKETPIYTSRTRYDALNRPTQLIAPHSDQPRTKINVIQPGYNEANLLEQVNAWINQSTEPAVLLNPATANLKAVTDIDYDAKGQRTLIDYGNEVRTTYEYDPLTFRLIRLLTIRGKKNSSDCAPVLDPRTCEDPPAICARLSSSKCILQNLHYTYDPVGNITHIQDDAQQIIYFKNKRVEPSADYTYDALYRLIEATGREHLGQIGGPPIPHSYNDVPRTGLLHPGDGNAMGRYCEKYVYDVVGNFIEMSHYRSCTTTPSWTRTYDYAETSLIEDGTGGTLLRMSNRLSSTTVGNGNPITEQYVYDAHGNITRMLHLPLMLWDFKDQLQATAKTVVNNGGTPETTYYVYDAASQRVRKVTERQAPAGQTPTRKSERIYLGGFEIYRDYEHDGTTVKLERETLHIMDDKQRIALVETRTQDNDPAPEELIRYQFSNHLGSASLELDHQAQIISYEEYTPYGSTSYQAVRNDIQVPLKRYRYSGMERDEESGLEYHSARYYLPWVGRWLSVDPLGIHDGVNTYLYGHGTPTNVIDADGREGGWWDETKQGIRTAQHWVKKTAFKAGEQVIDASDWAIDKAGIENKYLKGAIKGPAIVLATAVATVVEVGGGLVMIGPNLMLGVAEAPERIGHGASEIAREGSGWEAKLAGVGEILEGLGAVASAGLFVAGGVKAVQTRSSVSKANAPAMRGENVEVVKNPSTGKTPGTTYHRIVKDASSGKTTMKTTTSVSREGTVVSQHTDVYGKSGGFRGRAGVSSVRTSGSGPGFPDAWTGISDVLGPSAPHYAITSTPLLQSVKAQAIAEPEQNLVSSSSVEDPIFAGSSVEEQMSIDPSLRTPAEIEAQQCLPEPYRYY